MAEDISHLTFEEALKELETIVRTLESGETSLDDAISKYERGALLKDHCEKKLNEAKARVEKITLSKNGTPVGSEPLDVG